MDKVVDRLVGNPITTRLGVSLFALAAGVFYGADVVNQWTNGLSAGITLGSTLLGFIFLGSKDPKKE